MAFTGMLLDLDLDGIHWGLELGIYFVLGNAGWPAGLTLRGQWVWDSLVVFLGSVVDTRSRWDNKSKVQHRLLLNLTFWPHVNTFQDRVFVFP